MPLIPYAGRIVSSELMEVDERWVMSYAAGINDKNPWYYDNLNRTLVAHPMMYWAVSWPLIWNRRHDFLTDALTPAEAGRGVNYAEQVVHNRMLQAGEKVKVHGQVVEARDRRKGCTMIQRFDVHDEKGELILTQWNTTYYRDVKLGAAPIKVEGLLPPTRSITRSANPIMKQDIQIGFWDAHVYTECARIWNPIHTSQYVADKAGLSDIILHASCVVARVVTIILDKFGQANPNLVQEILGGTFRAPVYMPSTLQLEIYSGGVNCYCFDVKEKESGAVVIGGGYIVLSGKSSI